MKSRMFVVLCVLLAQSVAFADTYLTDNHDMEKEYRDAQAMLIKSACMTLTKFSDTYTSQQQCEMSISELENGKLEWFYNSGAIKGLKMCQ